MGIARAWELVGDRDTGIVASISVLLGRTPGPLRATASYPAAEPAGKQDGREAASAEPDSTTGRDAGGSAGPD
jgi:hypothetical protein